MPVPTMIFQSYYIIVVTTALKSKECPGVISASSSSQNVMVIPWTSNLPLDAKMHLALYISSGLSCCLHTVA